MHISKVQINKESFPVKDQYPFHLPVLENINEIQFKTPITFFIGENGCGKSTLLRAMALNAGIYIWQGIQRTRYDNNPYENDLYKYIDITWNDGKVTGSYFGAQHFYNFSQLIDEWSALDNGVLNYFGGKALGSQSHGQSILSYFKARYHKKGIYFLDEPETALSPASQIEFIKLLHKINQGSGIQMFIATHSPLLPACPGADIYQFSDQGITELSYHDMQYMQIYKSFLNDPVGYLGLES